MNFSIKNILNFLGLEITSFKVRKMLPKRDYSKYTNQILVEAWLSPSIILGLITFLPHLAEKYQARPISYYGSVGGLKKSLKEKLRNVFSIYFKIGIRGFKLFDFSQKNTTHLDLARNLIDANCSADQFEKIMYRDILVGDVVGDSFLRGNFMPTLDFNHFDLVEKLSNALFYIDMLYEYFEQNPVKAVVIIETTYMLALPGRVALQIGIDTFVITHCNVYRLTKKKYIAFHHYHEFNSLFRSLPTEVKKFGLSKAKEYLPVKLRNAGFGLVSNAHTEHFRNGVSFKLSKPIRLLVTAHDFFDSPHSVGESFFPDYFQWLKCIRDIALRNNYTLLLRPHPNARNWNKEVLEQLFAGVKNVEFIDSKISNEQLLQMGISAVLTVYGTVGSEWPLVGVPVINASPNHRHSRIAGNVTPTSRGEYLDILNNLNNWTFTEQNNPDGWAEYIFMRDFYMMKSFNTRYFAEAVGAIGLKFDWIVGRQFDWKLAYKVLCYEQYDSELIEKGFASFLESGDYFFHRGHIGVANKIEDYENYK
jgi:hypothetical protein